MSRVPFNSERLDIYTEIFGRLMRGGMDAEAENVTINMLIDIRWPEVSRAFVNCLVHESKSGRVRPLSHDFSQLVGKAATAAFGTSRHEEIPSWFLQNSECLLASSVHKLFVCFSETLHSDPVMRRAFRALFDVAEGLRCYVGLRHLAESTGAHVLMSAVANAKCAFLKPQSVATRRAELVFMDVLAENILTDPNRALDAQSAFCFFARSERWWEFAAACQDATRPTSALSRLLVEITDATARKTDPAPGLFFLASEFLQADRSPERPTRISKATTPTKPTHSAIAKRSAPFLRLVRRLLSDTA